MRDFDGRSCGSVPSGYQESRPWSGELLHDLALRRIRRHRCSGTGVLLAFARSDQPKEELARGLLIPGRKGVKRPLRSDPDRLSDATRSGVSIAADAVSSAQRPGFLEGILQKRQHAFVLPRLVEDILD